MKTEIDTKELERLREVEKAARNTSICMAYDAFRVCLGLEPKSFTYQQIKVWMYCIQIQVLKGEG